jgi:hypothetical protein
VWLVGGSADVVGTTVEPELWDPDGDQPAAVAPFPGDRAVALVGGGLLAAFGPFGEATVVAPLGGGRASFSDPTRAAASLTALDDGSVLVVGGAPAGNPGALRFRPHFGGGFEALDFAAGEGLTGHAAVLLADGAVLVAGGGVADAWIYRDRDLGPWGYIFREGFDDLESDAVVPSDPAAAGLEDGALVLRPAFTGAPLADYALVAGPRYLEVTLETTLTAEDGAGAAIVFAFRDPLTMWTARLEPGAPVTLVELIDGAATTLCTGGDTLSAADLAGGEVSFEARGERASLSVAGRQVLACGIPAPPRGAVGIGLLGAGTLRVDSLDVSR